MEKLEKRKKQFYIYSLIIVLVGIIIFVIMINSMMFFFPMLVFFGVTITIIISVLYNEMVKKPFKTEYVGTVLSKYNPMIKYTYNPNAENYKSLIKELSLIPSASSFSFRDMIEDEIDGIEYKSVDLHATHTQSTGKTTTTVTDFKGKFYDVKIKLDCCNYILKEEKWKRVPRDYELLDLESIEFNDKFNLYVTDRHEAHKLFTPSFIRNVIGVEKIYDNFMTIVYVDNHLYVLLYNKEDQFENVSDYDEGIIREYKEQVKTLQSYLNVFVEI